MRKNTLKEKLAAGKFNDARQLIDGFHHRLCTIRVLDPACGTGNFLYVSLELLKKLEGETLEALGGSARELPDGLIVRGGGLRGGKVHGWGDHRIVMAAAVAGLAAPEGVEVDTAEAMAVTFPDFCVGMRSLGARMETE